MPAAPAAGHRAPASMPACLGCRVDEMGLGKTLQVTHGHWGLQPLGPRAGGSHRARTARARLLPCALRAARRFLRAPPTCSYPALHTPALQTLMLVLSNPAPKGWAVRRLDGLTVSEDSEPVPIKTSLVVVPANLLGQVWGSGRACGEPRRARGWLAAGGDVGGEGWQRARVWGSASHASAPGQRGAGRALSCPAGGLCLCAVHAGRPGACIPTGERSSVRLRAWRCALLASLLS